MTNPPESPPAPTTQPLDGENGPFTRMNGESEIAHRSFVLWAMMAPDRRSIRAVGRAVSRAESTVREWRNRWGWVDRINAAGDLSDVTAAGVYRASYYAEHKLREMVEISDRMAAPFQPDMPIPAGVADSVRDAIRHNPDTDDETKRRKRTKRAHISLIDGALGLIAKRIAAGDVRVSLRDIPVLMQLRAEMNGNDPAAGGNLLAPIESTRVRHAKSTGGDIVAAMHDDAVELCAILGAIVSAGTVADSAAVVDGGNNQPAGGAS